MVKIKKKTWPEYFQAIVDGKKTYDFRLDDFKCGEGDILVLREWDPETKEYTGRVIEKKILKESSPVHHSCVLGLSGTSGKNSTAVSTML